MVVEDVTAVHGVQAGVVAGEDVVLHLSPTCDSAAGDAVPVVVHQRVERDQPARPSTKSNAGGVARDDVAGDGDVVGCAGDGDGWRHWAPRPGEGEAGDLGLHHPVEGDGTAAAPGVNDCVLGPTTYQPHVAGDGYSLVVSASADAHRVLGWGFGGLQSRHVIGRCVQGVLNLVKGVHLPGQAIVGAGFAIVVVGVVGGPALLDVADVHAVAGARRGWIGRIPSVNHRRIIHSAIVVGKAVYEQRIEEDLARAWFRRAEVGAVGPEVVVGVELRRCASIVSEASATVVGKDGVAHIHRRAGGRRHAVGVIHDGVVDHFQVGVLPLHLDAGVGAPDDVAGEGDGSGAVFYVEAVHAAVIPVQGDAGEAGPHHAFCAGQGRGVACWLHNGPVGAGADDLDAADQVEGFPVDARLHQHAVGATVDGGLEVGELFATGRDSGIRSVAVVASTKSRA